MEEIVVSLHKQITKSFNQNDRKTFDLIFQQMISMQPATELLRGLPTHKKLVVLRDAIIEFDAQQSDKSTSYIPIHNFVVNATFSALIASCKLKSGTNSSKPVKKPSKSKDVIPDDVVHAQQPANNKATCNATSSELIVKAPKTKRVRKPKNTKLTALYEGLTASLASDQHVYEQSKHIECSIPKCSYCRSLFVNIPLTQCKGHRSCNKAGWYPHVGSQLWNKLVKYHAKPNSTFVPKSEEIKKDQLPTYNMYMRTVATQPSFTPPHEWSTETDGLSDDDSSTITSKSSGSTASRKRRRETLAVRDRSSSMSWNEMIDNSSVKY